MTSVQMKFAAGLISLFIIPATHYLGQTTRLTPDDSAEPIYEFTETQCPPNCLKVKFGYIGDRNRFKKVEKKVIKDLKPYGIKIGAFLVEFEKGNDGKTLLKFSGKVIESKVSASEVNKIVNDLAIKYTAEVLECSTDNLKVESNLIMDKRITNQRSNSAPAR